MHRLNLWRAPSETLSELNEPAEPVNIYDIPKIVRSLISYKQPYIFWWTNNQRANDASHIKCKLCCPSHRPGKSRLPPTHHIYSGRDSLQCHINSTHRSIQVGYNSWKKKEAWNGTRSTVKTARAFLSGISTTTWPTCLLEAPVVRDSEADPVKDRFGCSVWHGTKGREYLEGARRRWREWRRPR